MSPPVQRVDGLALIIPLCGICAGSAVRGLRLLAAWHIFARVHFGGCSLSSNPARPSWHLLITQKKLGRRTICSCPVPQRGIQVQMHLPSRSRSGRFSYPQQGVSPAVSQLPPCRCESQGIPPPGVTFFSTSAPRVQGSESSTLFIIFWRRGSPKCAARPRRCAPFSSSRQ